MGAHEQINADVAKIFTAKHARRLSLAALPYPEKVRAVVQLQRMAVPVLKHRDKRAQVWQI